MHKYRIGITETVNFDNGLQVKKAVIRVQWARTEKKSESQHEKSYPSIVA